MSSASWPVAADVIVVGGAVADAALATPHDRIEAVLFDHASHRLAIADAARLAHGIQAAMSDRAAHSA